MRYDKIKDPLINERVLFFNGLLRSRFFQNLHGFLILFHTLERLLIDQIQSGQVDVVL